MWTCRNCHAENSDDTRACVKCGEKNVLPPKNAGVKPKMERKTPPLIVTLLNATAWLDLVVGVVVLIGILVSAPAGAFMLAVCTAAFALTVFAALKGVAQIVAKL